MMVVWQHQHTGNAPNCHLRSALTISELTFCPPLNPDRDWLSRYCIFGNQVCRFREAHPRARRWVSDKLCCHVADGLDKDRPPFQPAERAEIRAAFADILGRFSDLSFNYLDQMPLAEGYQFILCSHCQAARSTDFALYQITPHTYLLNKAGA